MVHPARIVVACLISLFVVRAGAAQQTLDAADRASLAEAYARARRVVVAEAEGLRADNPGQHWSTSFDGRGFLTRPTSAAWSWGLELRSYGRDLRAPVAARDAATTHAGERVTYAWDAQLDEWYLNLPGGLEHGYTLHARPAGSGSLAFQLRVRGDLRPVISPTGRDVWFRDESGRTRVDYVGLFAFDADGRDLPAHFTELDGDLLLRVDDRGARYPVTIDPMAHQAYLKASNTDAGDFFGTSVAVSGDTVVVGAEFEDSAAVGVDGDGSDNSVILAGAAYVFVRDGTSWVQQAYLKASNTGAFNSFGQSVAIDGDTIVVGAPGEGGTSTGVNGDQTQIFAGAVGAAYVFVRDGTTWSQQAYLKPPVAISGLAAGHDVAISGDTVAMGSRAGTGTASGTGAVHLFDRSGTTWTPGATLGPSTMHVGALFGDAVAIDGDTLIAGAPKEDILTRDRAGAAYVFTRSGGSWTEQARLTAPVPLMNAEFGTAVDVSGDSVVVGEPFISFPAGGNAHVFVRDGTSWTHEADLDSAMFFGEEDFRFGESVAMDGDSVLVGSIADTSLVTGVIDPSRGPPTFVFQNLGAAYLFERTGSTWSPGAYIKASNNSVAPAFAEFFGLSVALSGSVAVVGAPMERGSGSGVNPPSDDLAVDAGAAYVYELDGAWGDLANALTDGLISDPRLIGGGGLVGGEPSSLDLVEAEPSATAALFIGFDPNTPAPFKQGTLVPVPFFKVLFTTTSPLGRIPLPFVMPLGVPAGFRLYVQWAISDPDAPAGVTLSNALVGVAP